MPTDLESMIAPEWVAPDPRDVVFADVAQRARRLKVQRRVPALGALAVVTVLAATALAGGPTASPRLRTGPASAPTTIDQSIDTEIGSARVQAGARESTSDGVPSASARARGRAGGQSVGAGASVAERTDSPALDQLFTDRAGDARGGPAGCAGGTCTGASWFDESEPSADLLGGTMVLDGDSLTATIQIADLNHDLRASHPSEAKGVFAQSWAVGFTIADDDGPWILLQVTRNLDTGDVSYFVTVHNSVLVRGFDATGVWSTETNSVTIAASAEKLNELLGQFGTSDRVVPGAEVRNTNATGTAWIGTTESSTERAIDSGLRPHTESYSL